MLLKLIPSTVLSEWVIANTWRRVVVMRGRRMVMVVMMRRGRRMVMVMMRGRWSGGQCGYTATNMMLILILYKLEEEKDEKTEEKNADNLTSRCLSYLTPR